MARPCSRRACARKCARKHETRGFDEERLRVIIIMRLVEIVMWLMLTTMGVLLVATVYNFLLK